MLPNVPAAYEAHFAVPMAGAVLNTLNTRLEPESIAFMLGHAQTKLVIIDPEFAGCLKQALLLLGRVVDQDRLPIVIDVADPSFEAGERLGTIEYEDFLAGGDPCFDWQLPADEWNAISLNYTSGTTGNPKGVVYHHRGAYLNAVNAILTWNLEEHPVYLWTLPMFHCNGWCYPWTLAAIAGTSICLRKVDPVSIFVLIERHSVTHMCGAPIVYNLLINNAESVGGALNRIVKGTVAGAPPPKAVIAGAEKLGIKLKHVYGLTETYGPAGICIEQPEWQNLPAEERVSLTRRQGVTGHLQQAMTVMDPLTMTIVPADGVTMGEIMFRGNIVMKGYLKNEAATSAAFAGGWFHTGDLAVLDPDGYVVIKDRSKDIIISGGENISSVEVEEVLHFHPSILLAAVVAMPDEKWGEVPCAFIELKTGAEANDRDILDFCKSHLAGFKVPKRLVFGPLPKTATGKIQKFMLRQQAGSASAIY